MLTAKGQDMDILTGYQLGAASYMTEPFNLTELVDNINLFFQDRLTPKGEEDDDEEDEEDDGAGDETPAAEPAPPEDRPAAVKDAPAPPEPAPAGAGKKGSARRKKKMPAAADTPPGEG